MISDLANWVLINVLTNTRVLTSLLAFIILIVAGFLISDKKPAKKVPSKRILGAVLFVFAIFVFLYANIADLADVFTVWATLILAGVAIFSFEESRRLREENRQRENRDRTEHYLDRVENWLVSLATFAIQVQSWTLTGDTVAQLQSIYAHYSSVEEQGKPFLKIAEVLNKPLHEALTKTENELHLSANSLQELRKRYTNTVFFNGLDLGEITEFKASQKNLMNAVDVAVTKVSEARLALRG